MRGGPGRWCHAVRPCRSLLGNAAWERCPLMPPCRCHSSTPCRAEEDIAKWEAQLSATRAEAQAREAAAAAEVARKEEELRRVQVGGGWAGGAGRVPSERLAWCPAAAGRLLRAGLQAECAAKQAPHRRGTCPPAHTAGGGGGTGGGRGREAGGAVGRGARQRRGQDLIWLAGALDCSQPGGTSRPACMSITSLLPSPWPLSCVLILLRRSSSTAT